MLTSLSQSLLRRSIQRRNQSDRPEQSRAKATHVSVSLVSLAIAAAPASMRTAHACRCHTTSFGVHSVLFQELAQQGAWISFARSVACCAPTLRLALSVRVELMDARSTQRVPHDDRSPPLCYRQVKVVVKEKKPTTVRMRVSNLLPYPRPNLRELFGSLWRSISLQRHPSYVCVP
jgi:hypothetical protein